MSAGRKKTYTRKLSDHLPAYRGQLAQVSAGVLLFVAVCWSRALGVTDTLYQVFMMIGMLGMGDLLYSLCLLVEEGKHMNSHYDNSIWETISSVLPNVYCFGITGSMFCLLLAAMLGEGPSSVLKHASEMALLPLVFPLFCCFRGLREAELAAVLEKKPINVGAAMAWSFFFGYLRLVFGDTQKGLTVFKERYESRGSLSDITIADRIEAYERKEKVSIAVKKLFIILPEDCYCPKELGDIGEDKNLELERTIEPVVVSRAGIECRQYGQHSVYRILVPNNEPVRIVAEAATPLMSLYESSRVKKSGIGKKEKRQQMKLFCRSLRDILDRYPEIGRDIELVYHRNVDEDGNKVFLSGRLLRRVLEILQSERNGKLQSLSENSFHLLRSSEIEPSVLPNYELNASVYVSRQIKQNCENLLVAPKEKVGSSVA